MFKSDLGDVCGRFLTSRLSKQINSSSSSSKNSLNNERIANEHKSHTILNQKLLFKPYKKNPLEQLRKRYSNIVTTVNNDVVLTSLNNQTITKPLTPSNDKKNNTTKSSSSLMMNWELLKDRGSGLINLGNTCFINASLQCLANTPPLVQWLLSNSHYQYCRMKLENKFCLFCEAERIVKLIHSKNSYSSSHGPANPTNIARRIKDISKTFRIGRQEDASEFLICLIDKIVEACLRSSQPPERLRPSSGTSYEQLCHSQTFLHDLFGLVLRSRVICSRCRHTSDTFEVQYSWIVGVRNQSDLRQSLQQFVCRETLSGENLYRCMKCKQLVPAVKRYTLHKASKILLINLKRFEFGKNSHKLSHLVRYPENLNVKSYMSEENSNDQLLNYRLYAVLVHVGSSMHSGHYYSYVRSPNNRWYKADDTTMTQCDLHQVLTQHGAYILCYIQETDSSTTKIPHQNGKLNGHESTTTKIPYQNGKLNGHEPSSSNSSRFFTPQQIPMQNIPRQINGHTKSVNGNGILSQEKRDANGMSLPKFSLLSNKNKINNPTPILLTSTKNSNHSSIIKSSILNGFSSNLNHDEPVKKKQKIEDSSSLSSLSSSNSIDEQSVPSLNLKKKKKKKKFHLDNTNQNGSSSLITNGKDRQLSRELL